VQEFPSRKVKGKRRIRTGKKPNMGINGRFLQKCRNKSLRKKGKWSSASRGKGRRAFFLGLRGENTGVPSIRAKGLKKEKKLSYRGKKTSDSQKLFCLKEVTTRRPITRAKNRKTNSSQKGKRERGGPETQSHEAITTKGKKGAVREGSPSSSEGGKGRTNSLTSPTTRCREF